jgi:hypothetical protein
MAADRPIVTARAKFVPAAWEGAEEPPPEARALLVVDLGGETMRCIVREVVDDDTVIVEVHKQPFSRNHSRRQGDMVGALRKAGLMGETWQAVDLAVIHDIRTRHALERAKAQAEEKRRQRAAAAAAAPPAKKRGERK